MDCNHHGWSFTHCTPTRKKPDKSPLTSCFILTLDTLPPLFTLPADVRLDALSGDRGHGHGHRLGRGQPVRVVVAGGEVADVVYVAEHERHGAEPAQTAASRTLNTREIHSRAHFFMSQLCDFLVLQNALVK